MKWWVKEIGHKWVKMLYIKCIETRILKKAAAIHFLSETERCASSDYLPNNVWSFIVPNGINVQQFKIDPHMRVALRNKFGVPERAIILLHAGRIHPQKNMHLVIESLKLLQRQDLYYFIVGPIDDEKYYNNLKAQLRKYGLTDRVIFVGPVPYSEIAQYYAFADLLVMPSKVEGLSMTVIEALTCALPVVVSERVANAQEILANEAGLVIKPNVEDLLTAIRSLTACRDGLKKMGANAFQMARRFYDVTVVAGLMKQAYIDILSEERSEALKWKKSGRR
jgi:glycosyltransferase involved in cell wall biosynthesis